MHCLWLSGLLLSPLTSSGSPTFCLSRYKHLWRIQTIFARYPSIWICLNFPNILWFRLNIFGKTWVMSCGHVMPIFSIIGNKFDHLGKVVSPRFLHCKGTFLAFIINIRSINTVWISCFLTVFHIITFAFMDKLLPESLISIVVVKEWFFWFHHFSIFISLAFFCKEEAFLFFLFFLSFFKKKFYSFSTDAFLSNTLWFISIITHCNAQIPPDSASGNPFRLALLSFRCVPLSFLCFVFNIFIGV